MQLLLRKKATEELKKEQEMKAAERRKVTKYSDDCNDKIIKIVGTNILVTLDYLLGDR